MVRERRPKSMVSTELAFRKCSPRQRPWPFLAACLAVLACAHDLSAQVTYNIVADLASIGGAAPLGGVVRSADGSLYGTTSEGGGAENCGLIYRLDSAGQLSVIHQFSAPDGCLPVGELALGPDGSLYGVTARGGLSSPQLPLGAGTIYKIAANGAFTVLYRFEPPPPPESGEPEPYLAPYAPYAGLTLGPDGFFYGTLRSDDIFRISPDGAFSLVHQFVETGNGEPILLQAALVVGADGYLYSTSPAFSLIVPRDRGTVFRVSLDGNAEVLRRFFFFTAPDGTPVSPDGGYPSGEVAIGLNGELYGANSTYGPDAGTDRGTVFRLDPDGTFTLLHAFSRAADQSYPDGASPVGGLILGSDGQVYGRTSAGGANGNGTFFRIGPDGVFTALRSFPQDGFTQMKGRLLEASPGVFYGTAHSASGGVVYQMALASSSLSVSVVAPVGGEKLYVGVPTTIEWTATGANSIDVELSRDGGGSFTAIAECTGLPGSSTNCLWTPAGPHTPKARIRVVAHGAAGEQASDTTERFRIKK